MENKTLKEILLVLDLNTKASVKQNKLLTISSRSEDYKLKELLNESARIYSYWIEYGKSWIPHYVKNEKWDTSMDPQYREVLDVSRPYNNQQWEQMITYANKKLVDYVQVRLSENKPDWQVEAERMGWVHLKNF